MAKPDGGPAFPQTEYYDEQPIGTATGMTLRDYFAAQAMAACIGADSSANQNYSANPPQVAQYAYEFADAMLAERAK